jgi:hypothetical protein
MGIAKEKFSLIEERKNNVTEEKASLYKNGMSKKEAALKLRELIKNNGGKPLMMKSCDGEENSVKVLSHPDKNGYGDVTIHRFTALLFGHNVVYITLKEVNKYGKRIYSIELIELGKLEGIIKKSIAQKSPAPFPASSFP